MKGLKKCRTLLSLSLLCVFSWVVMLFFSTGNASAASLGTSSFDLYYSSIGESYQWRNNITYGNSSPTVIDSGGGVQRYQFNTTSVQAGGNYASLHFETNIVSSSYRNLSSYNPWVNLQQQNILTCSASGISVVTKNLSYVTTYWTNSDGANNTLTFYGDLTLSGFNQNQSYTLVCAIGSANYSFISSGAVWFEQNPMSITWFNDESIAILQTQTNQNNIIINNQNETNDWLKDDTPPNADTSVISGAAGWLPAGPVDSVLTLPMTFAQGIVDIFTGQHQCSPIVLPFNFINSSITIPCLDSFFLLSGVNLIWNGVGTIIAAFVLYDTFKWLYKFVDDTLTLRENSSGLWGGL